MRDAPEDVEGAAPPLRPVPRLGPAGLWAFLGTLTSGAASTGIALVLAGFVGPTEYGEVAAALVVYELVAYGLNPAYGQAVQALPRSEAMDQTAWTLAFVTGMVSGALLALASAPAAALIGIPSAARFITWLSVALCFRRWSELRIAQLERSFAFSASNGRTMIAAILAAGAAIGGLYGGLGAAALVLFVVLNEAALAVMLVARRPVARLGWQRDAARSLVRFTRALLGSSAAVAVYTTGDDAAVGRLGGAELLGMYAFAYRFPNLAALLFARPTQRALLPALRQLRDDDRPWLATYLSVLRQLSFVSGLAMGVVTLHGPAALELLYGGEWSGAAVPLQIFSVYGAFRAVGAVAGTVFVAAGEPETVRRITVWQTGAMLALIVPGTLLFGVAGAAAAATLPACAGITYALGRSARLAGSRSAPAMAVTAGSWGRAGVVVVACAAPRLAMEPGPGMFVSVLLSGVVGAAVWRRSVRVPQEETRVQQ